MVTRLVVVYRPTCHSLPSLCVATPVGGGGGGMVYNELSPKRTRPSAPSCTANTLPTGHWLRASCRSRTKTRSPSLTFLWGSCHLVRCRSSCRYSRVHRLQVFHLAPLPAQPRVPCVEEPWRDCCQSVYQQVIRREGLEVGRVTGYGRDQAVVYDPLGHHEQRGQHLVGEDLLLGEPARILLTDRICRSHTPPMCEAAGGLNIHWILFSLSSSWTRPWFHSAISRRSSRSAPTKLVPLSDLMSFGSSLRATKRWRQLMNESLPIVSATSMCTARVTRQVNRHPYFFSRPLPVLTGIGPK